MGVLYASQHRLHPQGRYLYMVGFCGSFTTVSLFSKETVLLLTEGNWLAGLSNILIPVAASLIIVGLIVGPVEKVAERRKR